MRVAQKRPTIDRMEEKETDPALEEARRVGIDLALLDTNLALSVEERWRQHDAALALALKLEAAGKRRRGELRPTPESPR